MQGGKYKKRRKNSSWIRGGRTKVSDGLCMDEVAVRNMKVTLYGT